MVENSFYQICPRLILGHPKYINSYVIALGGIFKIIISIITTLVVKQQFDVLVPGCTFDMCCSSISEGC